jgi:hypothetical protein
MARGKDPGFAVIAKLTDQFTRPIENINNKIAQSTAKLRGMAAVPGAIARSTGLDRVGSSFANVGKSVLNLRNSITGLLGPLTRMGALIGGFALGKAITDAVTLGGELIKLSKNTGVSVEELQRLRYAAQQSGLGAEELDDMLLKLGKAMRDARKDTKGTTDAFKAMKAAGVDMKGLRNGTVSITEVFNKLADAVHDSTDEVVQGSFAVAGFGRSGQSAIAFLGEGSEKIRELGKDAAVMSDDTAAASKKFGDVMLKMSQHVKDLAYSILEKLLPGMTGTAEETDAWMAANKPDIIKTVVDVVGDLVDIGRALRDLFRNDIIPVFKALKPAWTALENVIGAGNAKLLAFSLVVAPGVVGAILGVGKALLGLVATLTGAPIAVAIIGFAALFAYAAYKIYQDWDNIKRQTADTGAALLKTFRETKQNIENTSWSDITDKFTEAWEDSIAATRAVGARLKQTFSEVWANIKTTWAELDFGEIGSNILTAFDGLSDAIWGVLTSPIQSIKDAWEGFKKWFQGLFNWVLGRSSNMTNAGNRGDANAGYGQQQQEAPAGAYAGVAEQKKETPGGAYAGIAQQQKEPLGGAYASIAQQQQQPAKSEFTVNFDNLPAGARVSEDRSTGNTDVKINKTYAGQHAPAGAY